MEEFIVCSAVMFDGFPVAGRRHSDCYATIKFFVGAEYKDISNSKKYDYRSDQGFLTSTNRFVNRKEAWKIALKNNQIEYGLKVSDNGEDSQLISENLYGCD